MLNRLGRRVSLRSTANGGRVRDENPRSTGVHGNPTEVIVLFLSEFMLLGHDGKSMEMKCGRVSLMENLSVNFIHV